MAIQFVGRTGGHAVGSTTTDLTISLNGTLTGGIGSSPSAGDLVVVAYSCGATSDKDLNIVTSGYTRWVDLYADDDQDTNLWFATKFMGSTPDTSVVVGRTNDVNASLAASIHVYRGVDPTIFDVTTLTDTGKDIGKPTCPPITPVTAGSVIVCIGANAFTSSSGLITNVKLTNVQSDTGTDSVATNVALGYKIWTSGEFVSGQWVNGSTQTTASWCAVSLVLRPLASGPANLKTYNTNPKANIKTINTNPIANVKTLNTNV